MLTNKWDSYSIVFLSALLALFIPIFLAFLSWLLSLTHQKRAVSPSPKAVHKGVPKSAPVSAVPSLILLGGRIHVRFFLATNAALILITLSLLLIPFVTVVDGGGAGGAAVDWTSGVGVGGVPNRLLGILSVALFAALGLLYSIHKEDMG